MSKPNIVPAVHASKFTSTRNTIILTYPASGTSVPEPVRDIVLAVLNEHPATVRELAKRVNAWRKEKRA